MVLWFYASLLLCFYAYFISTPIGPLALGPLSTSNSYFYFHPHREDARQDRATLLDPDAYHRQAGSWWGLQSDSGSNSSSLFQPLFQPLYLSHQLSHPHHQTTSHYHRQNNHHNHRHHHHFTSNSSPTSPRNHQLSQFKITFHFIVSFSVS